MSKRKMPIYLVGSFSITLVIGLIYLTIVIASGSFHMRKSKLVIETESASRAYSGMPLQESDWRLVDGELNGEHTLKVKVYGEQTSIGESPNYATVEILDAGGYDVTDQYDIELKLGTLEITRIPLTYTSDSAFKMYDGESLSAPYAVKSKGHTLRGHRSEFDDFAEVKTAGVHQNEFQVRILDAEDVDYTDYYDITYEYGELTIRYDRLEILSGSAEKIYDGTPLSEPKYTVKSGHVRPEHTLTVHTISQIDTVGMATNNMVVKITDQSGNDVTGCYELALNYGTLVVTPRRIVIRTADVTRSRREPAVEDYSIVDGSLVEGHQVVLQTYQSSVDQYSTIGRAENSVMWIYITTENMLNDVTNCYQIIYQHGYVEITE